MTLFIQIPCLNEAKTLPATLASLPKTIPGIDTVKILVIDDGSTDGTAEVAREHGADHILTLAGHQGLARAFGAGLEECLRLGADIIVNTDADNQYCAEDIPALAAPVLAGKAAIVVGERPIEAMAHFSKAKKWLQRQGSAVVRMLGGIDVRDATSGFRALSRDAALRLNIFSGYTYTLEMLLQARQKNLPIVNVPIRVNGITRPSRLVKSTFSYVLKSFITITRVFLHYAPLRFFAAGGLFLCGLGLLIGLRFLWLLCSGEGHGHTQSLILASVLTIVGFQLIVTALQADLTAVNRRIMEDIQYRLRKRG